MSEKETFINSSCGICWKKALKQAEETGKDVHIFYIALMRDCIHPQPKTKARCPNCKALFNVLTSTILAAAPIDRPKCGTCFRNGICINLVPFNVPGVAQDKGERT